MDPTFTHLGEAALREERACLTAIHAAVAIGVSKGEALLK